MKIGADAARNRWRTFWFRPEPLFVLGMVRLAFGLIVVGWALSLFPDLGAFFTSGGVLAKPRSDLFEWGVLQHSADGRAVLFAWSVLLLAAVALSVGWHSRIAAALVFVLVLSFQYRNPLVFNAGDVLLRVEAFVIALAPSGAALSLDERRRTGSFWSAQTRAPWALRVLQLQLTVVYVATFAARMTGEKWPAGTAVSYALRLEDMVILRVPSVVLDSPAMMNVGTWTVLLGELMLGILIWIRRIRPVVVAIGVALHLAIMVTIAVAFFSPAMLLLYLAFLPCDVAERRVRRRAGVTRSEPGETES
ncbi:HTTM domain-containing protein [Mycolicibacterium sp. BiH015]|uniref:HTTM domain-containing protein n=1 Tax=Mycolicibacterium sp. BiH015 TaxID=3018808 RepID=UPI0022E14F1F|nr:HTTM domain-containing protein [Mycolicibacterium sp. BiH015]MDA2892638.1 HTTM domain-containing protein [Mycolicibacterium sp. BiH015]